MSLATMSTPAMSRPIDLRGLDRAGRHLRVNQFSDVGRGAAGAQVRVAANQHVRTGRRNRVGVKPCSPSTASAI